MRIVLIVLIAVVALGVGLPAVAQESTEQRDAYTGNCNKLSNQIARYQRDLGWAQDRGNELWAESNRRQIARLASRRERRCPEFAKDDNAAARKLAALLGLAAKAAARYFTMSP